MAIAAIQDIEKGAAVTVQSRIRLARESAGLTRARLAEMTGLTVKSIEKYETQIEPPLSKLKLLMEALDLSPEDVFAEVDAPPAKSKVKRLPEGQDQNAALVQSLAALLNQHGIKVRFPANGQVELDQPAAEDAQGLEGQDQLQALLDATEAGGVKAKALPQLITVSKQVLNTLDVPAIQALADHFEFVIEGFQEMETLDDMSADQLDRLTDEMAEHLIAQAIYPDLPRLTDTGILAIRDHINRMGTTWNHPVRDEGLFEKKAEYRAWLRRVIPGKVLELVTARKPIDISDRKAFPRESRSRGRGE